MLHSLSNQHWIKVEGGSCYVIIQIFSCVFQLIMSGIVAGNGNFAASSAHRRNYLAKLFSLLSFCTGIDHFNDTTVGLSWSSCNLPIQPPFVEKVVSPPNSQTALPASSYPTTDQQRMLPNRFSHFKNIRRQFGKLIHQTTVDYHAHDLYQDKTMEACNLAQRISDHSRSRRQVLS